MNGAATQGWLDEMFSGKNSNHPENSDTKKEFLISCQSLKKRIIEKNKSLMKKNDQLIEKNQLILKQAKEIIQLKSQLEESEKALRKAIEDRNYWSMQAMKKKSDDE